MKEKRKRITIEFAKQKFSERGYTLLENEYINAQTHMKYTCDKGHSNTITWNNFKKGAGCYWCNGKVKPTYHYVQEEFEKQNCILLSEIYVNAKTNLKYLCPNGHECEITWDHFKTRGYGCKKCNGSETHTYEYIQQQFKNEGCTLITNYYKNAHQSLEYICPNGHKCKVRYNKFQQGDRCNTCGTMRTAEKRRKTQEQFKNEVFELVGDEYVVLGEYKNIDTNISMKHIPCDFEWSVIPYHFLKTGTRCPKCSLSKGENTIYEYLKRNNIKFEIQYRIIDCKNERSLPFDFAVFDNVDTLKFLIEFDGRQHFEPVEWFGGEQQFKIQQERDQIKNEYCKENNIKLIRIPYWEFDRIDEILTELIN